VWTPKRIVLLALGFALFVTGYLSYAFVLGGIDGLPPLPVGYEDADRGILPPPRFDPPKVERLLRQAFGLECQESKRPIKLELARNNMVLASESARFTETDGRLVLEPFSVAVFGKPKNDGKGVEINTIRADIAILTFDKPITEINPNVINGRKITGAELTGNIEVVNNRRTARRDDDLELFVKTGPVYYREETHLIYTHDEVHLTDRGSKPKPHEVWGKGLEMELAAEPAPASPGKKPRQDTITGVKRITLQSNVVMHLYVDGSSGFLGQSKDKGAAAKAKPDGKVEVGVPPAAARDAVTKAAEAPDKLLLDVTTPGRFQYFFHKDYDTAEFEVTPGNHPGPAGRAPRDVSVIRYNEKLNTRDQLFCQRLDLKLLRKDARPAAKDARPADKPADDSGQTVDIESAHATGKEVTLSSDTEKLMARDIVDLLYEAKKGLTVLKGDPRLTAEKEGHRIVTRELQIQEVKVPGSDKGYQNVLALGPGQIDLLDKKADKYLQHASWNDTLTATKDERALTAKGAMQDLLVLTGAARFVDDERGQTLQGETVKVWFSQGERPAPDKATPASSLGAAQQAGVKPEHIEAIKNVSAQSSELNIHDTGRLVVRFKEATPEALPSVKDLEARPGAPPLPPPPGALPGDLPPAPRGDVRLTLPPAPVPPPDHRTGKPADAGPAPRPGAAPAPKAEEPRPIDLSARSVEVDVLRGETKNSLEKLWTEGNVHVHQAPANPGEQGVDITGETLNIFCHPDGNLMTVTGNEKDFARLRMDQIFVMGPQIQIDQVRNEAEVKGAGAMIVNSKTTLSGQPLDRSVPLTIQWDKSMFLAGRYAEFSGNVQATQEPEQEPAPGEAYDKGWMACNVLHVNFDRPISLKEGNKGDKSPQVERLLCEEKSRVEERAYEGKKLTKYQRLESRNIEFEALEPDGPGDMPKAGPAKAGHKVYASGGGKLIFVQRGGTDPLAPANPDPAPGATKPPDPAKAADPDQLKLTRVEFSDTMNANNKTNAASFRRNVRVIHLPVADPLADVDIDVTLAKLPEGAMYLSCNQLNVYTRQEKGKNYQEMHATEQAVVQSRDFWGRAASIHFDESKDQVIFDGGPGGTATLFKAKQQGGQWDQIIGRKIIYNRKTGAFNGDGVQLIESNGN
jgi:lipopolysaccharide export system protein LptA